MRALSIFLLPILLLGMSSASRADFVGWRDLVVIEQDGRPQVMRAADLDGDGRQELILVNGRSSRLDTYHWLNDSEREAAQSPEEDRPNELPMTNRLRREELQLERLPQDVLVRDLDSDGVPEIVVLVSPPLKVMVFNRTGPSQWDEKYQIELLDAEIASRRNALLIRQLNDRDFELLVSCSDGIQQLPLRPDGRPHWLAPREQRDRSKWWMADLDEDHHCDLIEQTRDADEAIRWYRCAQDGSFLPAEVLYDRAVSGAEVLCCDQHAFLALLDGSVNNLLRRYKLKLGEPTPLGRQRPLALAGGQKAVWCGLRQADSRALVLADPNSPRLLSYVLSDEGWQSERAYPAVGDVVALAAPSARPGMLLIWVKDAAELRMSRWEDDRLTYPQAWPEAAEADDRSILALKSVGDVTWWVQKVGNDLELFRWQPDAPEPSSAHFVGVGAKADEVLWIGGDQLLVREQRARGLKHYALKEGKLVISAPPHLQKSTLSEFRLIPVSDKLQLGRFTEGVLQWLGDDLRSRDQVMLSDGQELADFVADDSSSGWALQKGAPYIHRIEADDAGIKRSVDRYKIATGTALLRDEVLGLLLRDSRRIIHLSEGTPRELQLVDMVDERVGRSGGVRETQFHRVGRTDIDGDGRDELLLFDDLRHRVTVLRATPDSLETEISWPVFDDKKYPYDEESEDHVREPRTILGVDLNGDQLQDLAMICHDRLIIYLAHE